MEQRLGRKPSNVNAIILPVCILAYSLTDLQKYTFTNAISVMPSGTISRVNISLVVCHSVFPFLLSRPPLVYLSLPCLVLFCNLVSLPLRFHATLHFRTSLPIPSPISPSPTVVYELNSVSMTMAGGFDVLLKVAQTSVNPHRGKTEGEEEEER